ncbi:MAG: TraB/VirB10 family protein [Legionellaceae bacterium]|nr:TraB/VirB10 family protein [Legionellaceae bacterium]
MANFAINKLMLHKQRKYFLAVIVGLLLVLSISILLISKDKPHLKSKVADKETLTGVVDASFSAANTESALSMQQSELESLKNEMLQLQKTMLEKDKKDKKRRANHKIVVSSLPQAPIIKDIPSWKEANINNDINTHPISINSISFRYKEPRLTNDNHLNPEHYVPSGTFVRAVVLGGADADASVNGQSKNNGVMLFKLMQKGTLPNGEYSHLQGCFVTASSYGDISSERAYVVLDKLSCAQKGKPIIDKAVTGWAFFGGKVGIKGRPLMRDNKIMQWAGISGALSGIASAAQYSQSIQNVSTLGQSSLVPSSNIAPYAAYGGASKASEVLSNYYVKRAEQYHPVIQVGSGSLVTIVFKDGFYLEPEEDTKHKNLNLENTDENSDFTVPTAVLNRIDKSNLADGVEP